MRWIVFDYGEVISRRTRALPDLAALAGADLGAFTDAYWRHRRDYDAGLPDLDYWRLVAGLDVDETLAGQLTKTDVSGWLEVDPSTVELLGEIVAAGARLALLSNAPSSFGRAAEGQPWTRQFSQLLFSGDLGVVKPDTEIWEALVARLGASVGDCVFLDDRQENIDGATLFGLKAHLWTSAADARRYLTEIGVL
ncbi:HAD-IA family hydrolase [Actinocrispum sp. NPDC049592]|uniref:HAD-IA family hydrolase n=1 Tax=Actinocrispum sp. NPDC049592 TaxID=3154835 RepID=UPI0034279F82